MRDVRYISILLVLSAFLFLYGLGNMALTDPDETFYAETAKEMLDEGEWVTPLIFGKPQFEKPILYYWLVEASFKLFGVNEFAARLPSAVFGMIGVIGVYFVGRALFSPLAGFLSGVVAATAAEYVVIARACVTDIVLTAFILLCFLFFLLGLKRERKIFYIISAIMAALAVLTKGPIGVFLTVIVIGAYIILTKQWEVFRKARVISAVLVFLIVSLPWYLIVLKIHGDAFVNEFFGIHNIIRFIEPEHRIGSSPFFYLPVILGGFLPWTPFLIFGAWYMFRDKNVVSDIKVPQLFLALWFLLMFAFFTASRTKLVTYIFPVFPALALMTGRFWERFLEDNGRNERAGHLMRFSYGLLTLVIIAGLLAEYFAIKIKYPQVLQGALISSIVFSAGVLISLIFFIRKKYWASFYALTLAVALLTVAAVRTVLPVIEEYETSKAISYKVVELAQDDEAIGGESDHRRGIAFYTGRVDIVDIHPYEGLVNFLLREEQVWGVIQKKHYTQVKTHRSDLIFEPVFEAGDYVIITNREEK